jgi:hypothetical protein
MRILPQRRVSTALIPEVVQAMTVAGSDHAATTVALKDLADAGITTPLDVAQASIPELVEAGLPVEAAREIKRAVRNESHAVDSEPKRGTPSIRQLQNRRRNGGSGHVSGALAPAVVSAMHSAGENGPSVSAVLDNLADAGVTTPKKARDAPITELLGAGMPVTAARNLKASLRESPGDPINENDEQAELERTLRKSTDLGAMIDPKTGDIHDGWFTRDIAPWFLLWMKTRFEAEEAGGFKFPFAMYVSGCSLISIGVVRRVSLLVLLGCT